MHTKEAVEKAAESTMAKAIARFGTPIMLAIIAWFGRDYLNDIRLKQELAADKGEVLTGKIAELTADVRVINTRLDVQVINRLDDVEKKVEELERAQKVR